MSLKKIEADRDMIYSRNFVFLINLSQGQVKYFSNASANSKHKAVVKDVLNIITLSNNSAKFTELQVELMHRKSL